MAKITEAYDITTISLKKRLLNSIFAGIPTIGLGIFAFFMAYEEREYKGIFGSLLFFIGGCYLSYKIYTTKEKRELKGSWEVIQSKEFNNRGRNTLILIGLHGAVIGIYIYLTYTKVLDANSQGLGVSYFIFIVISVCYLVPLWSPKGKRLFKLTEAAALEKQRLDALIEQKGIEDAKIWEEREKQWWFRYPLAALICVGAWWLSDIKPNLWWVSIIGAIYATVLAWELSALILGIGAIYLLFQGMASLPVGVAIIIGALIIASAIKS
jgi:hypothetical protein